MRFQNGDPESFLMLLPMDTCRDPDRGHILTTTDPPSASALVGARRESERAEFARWLFLSVLVLGSQKIVQSISLHHEGSLVFNVRCHFWRPVVT